MSRSLSPRPDVSVLPSLPPSPSLLDEVFSHPRPWSVRFDSPPGSTKGKERETLEDEDRAGYPPPMPDDAAETRRVEANLKRWELAERRRRKSARESLHRHTSRPSLLSSVTHTASLVLSGRSSVTSTRPSTRTFKSLDTVDSAREGSVPLDDIDTPRASPDIAVHSPSHSVFERNPSLDASAGTGTEDPFVHPSERTPSPLLGAATPTPASPPPRSSSGEGLAQNKTHVRGRSSASRISVPPPRPLGLPSPSRDMPPQPTPQPVLQPPPRQDPEERQEVRWWHDWLCGCNEGPDRGGDHQAGRTNPFE